MSNQTSPTTAAPDVMRCGQTDRAALASLAERYGAVLAWVDSDAAIPGSFWGECEAGLVGNALYVREDTPVHSALHELCHYICMDAARRIGLHTDAGGDYEEENGVCFLQILLANALPTMGQKRMLADMDTWGYSFRLGSACAWFESDAEDARDWLLAHDLIDSDLRPTGRLRGD